VHYFKAYPLLAILGGKDGIDIKFNHQEQIGKGVLSESSKEKDFNFVQAVNRAPMWINKELFVEKLKHIDQTFAPFQYDDYEICIRAWLSGLQVGHYDAGFKSLSVGGMRLWNNLLIQHQCLANGQKLYKMYASEEEQIQRFIVDAQKKK
jgi:hypothetical protein